MIYDLANELDRQRFRHRTAYLLEKGSKVEMSEKSFRTGGQNRYLHLLIGVVALDVGVTLDYAKQEYYKRLVNADIYCIEREDKFVGKANVLRSSADLTKEEMAMSIDRFKRCRKMCGDVKFLTQTDHILSCKVWYKDAV